jgi:hypothetical protein
LYIPTCLLGYLEGAIQILMVMFADHRLGMEPGLAEVKFVF